MKEYNSTANNVKIEVDWANKKGWLSLPIDKESIFTKIIIPSLFVFISYKLGWIYGIAYLVVAILFDKIENKKISSFFLGLLKLSNNNSSQFSQNFMLSPQNQNFQYFPSSPWSNVKEVTPQETFELGAKPQYVYVDIHGAEIAEIREKVERLERKLEEKEKQQIIPIQFLESEKLLLKQPVVVSLVYSSEGGLWIVDCPELNLYGEGIDEVQAVNDFKIVLEEFYFGLKKDKEKLGPELKKKWDILQQIIREK